MAKKAAKALTPNETQGRRGESNDTQALETLDEVIADLRIRIEQVSELIDAQRGKKGNVTELAKLFALHSQSASRLGRLLRDRHAISDDPADGLAGLVAEVIDEVGPEAGWVV